MSRPLQDLYRETIMRHAKQPANCHADPSASRQARLTNPLCGDEITVFLRLSDTGDRVEALSFQAQSCSLCTASASMLTDALGGLEVSQAEGLSRALLDSAKAGFEDFPSPENSELQALQGVKAFPSRTRCVTLPWEAFLAALSQSS